MRPFSFLFLISLLSFFACEQPTTTDTSSKEEIVDASPADPAMILIDELINAMGGMEAFRQVKDVEYIYTRETDEGIKRLSQERYLYPSEWSWAKYFESSNPANKDEKGELIQAYSEDKVWVTFNGEQVEDEKSLQRARFSRKTNFYWLNMFFKMKDPGLTYELAEDRTVEGQTYNTVKVSFEDNIGDAKDVYFLYVNTDTKLVDYFLFTVMEFDRSEPIMMKIKYEEVGGLQWPTYRASVNSNWEGEVPGDVKWLGTILQDLKVNTGFSKDIFIAK